jgi:hypothetical protein
LRDEKASRGKRLAYWGRMMNLEILKFHPVTRMDFVLFWSSYYKYKLEPLYDVNIGKHLTEDRVWSLYKWKNGTTEIAAGKKQSILNVYLKELKSPRILSGLPRIEDGKKYVQDLKGGAIWDIFWLHCINPKVFPIFDQHTYRSMAKIEGLTPSEISKDKPNILKSYFSVYVPFTQKFSGFSEERALHGLLNQDALDFIKLQPGRALDRALFTYGRFLKKCLLNQDALDLNEEFT